MSKPLPIGLTIATALALIVLSSLGVWQVQRLQWKTGLIAAAEAAAARPPVGLETLIASREPMEFRRVRLTCPGLDAAPYVELQSIHDGQAGVRLISACRAAGTTWLVDRGFVADAISARPPVDRSATRPVAVEAEIRDPGEVSPLTPPPADSRFYGRDPEAMARALGVAEPVEPETLFALTSSNPEWAALAPSAPPAAFSNNHLGYALTWFGLAAALIAFYIALIRRRLRGGAA